MSNFRRNPRSPTRARRRLSTAAVLALALLWTGAGRPDDAAAPNAGSLVDLAPAHVRADFAAGVVALHDFWYGEAAERFRAVQRGAPEFTLGYWGEALSLHRNPFGFAEPPTGEMRAILGRLAPTPEARAAMAGSEHERRYLAALEILVAAEGQPSERHPTYARAMAGLAADFPDDIEAHAFHARAIFLEAETFGMAPDVRRRSAETAARVLERDPDHHGGLHYFIHGMDSPDRAAEARDAAIRYQRLATGASHAAHMPSHIFMQLGDWDRVVAGNEAALEASRAFIERTDGTEADLDRHALDFMHYALLQQGREREARAIAGQAHRHRAEFDTGAIRWYDGLWSTRLAGEAGARAAGPFARSGYDSVSEALALGLHAVAVGDTTAAVEQLEAARGRAEEGAVEWRIAALEIEAALDGTEQAIPPLEEAISLQREMGRPNETPVLIKPPEELLGEILLSIGRPREALEAFAAGDARWPARLATVLGFARAYVALGDRLRARAAYDTLLRQLRLADPGHPAVEEARAFVADAGAPSTRVP